MENAPHQDVAPQAVTTRHAGSPLRSIRRGSVQRAGNAGDPRDARGMGCCARETAPRSTHWRRCIAGRRSPSSIASIRHQRKRCSSSYRTGQQMICARPSDDEGRRLVTRRESPADPLSLIPAHLTANTTRALTNFPIHTAARAAKKELRGRRADGVSSRDAYTPPVTTRARGRLRCSCGLSDSPHRRRGRQVTTSPHRFIRACGVGVAFLMRGYRSSRAVDSDQRSGGANPTTRPRAAHRRRNGAVEESCDAASAIVMHAVG